MGHPLRNFQPDCVQGDLFRSAVAAHYSQLAEWMNQQSWYKDNQAVRSILSLLDFRPRRILELCCGSGSTLKALGQAFPKAEVVGVDISERMVRMASAKLSNRKAAHVTLGDWIYNLPPRFRLHPFDTVVVKNALHLLDELPERLQALRPFIHRGTALIVVETVSPTVAANRFVRDLFQYVDRSDLKQSFFTAHTLGAMLEEGGWIRDHDEAIYIMQHIDVQEWLRKKCSGRESFLAAKRVLEFASGVEPLHRAMHFDSDPGVMPDRMLRLQYIARHRPVIRTAAAQLHLRLIEAVDQRGNARPDRSRRA